MVSEGTEQVKSEKAWKIVVLEVVMEPRGSSRAEGYAKDYKAVWFPKAQGVDHCREEEAFSLKVNSGKTMAELIYKMIESNSKVYFGWEGEQVL